MIKIILMDCDGPIIKHKKYFSQRLVEELGVSLNEKSVQDFFQKEFRQIEVGKGDLKAALEMRAEEWGWKKSVNELLDFWFSGEAEIDEKIINHIKSLRSKNLKVYLSTNNEKYRTEYLWSVIGLKNHFDGLLSSCYLGFLKPEQGFWQKAYENLSNYSKAEILVWDDEPGTVESVKNFGFQAEYFKDFESFKETMKKYL